MKNNLYIGIDVGGTKIAVALVSDDGKILAREKIPTPTNETPSSVVRTIIAQIKKVLNQANLTSKDIAGIGVGIPGIVDSDQNRILVTPNINLSGISIAYELKKEFKIEKIAAGNDVNLGLLGEHWLGAAQSYDHVISLFLGTGVGGGIIQDGRLVLGARGAAGELGHMTLDFNGPLCGCGNRGCLEAYAGRWAIERDIREALKKGAKTILTEINDGNIKTIKSKALKESILRKDPLVTGIVKKAAEMTGIACISLKHIFNPQVIILGGGVMEACGNFILPIVKKVVDEDPFFSKLDNCKILPSKLEDDAGILGAVALVRGNHTSLGASNRYPQVTTQSNDGITVDGIPYHKDLIIRADGKIKLRKESDKTNFSTASHRLLAEDIEKLSKKTPEIIFIGTGIKNCLQIPKESENLLKDIDVEYKIATNPEIIKLYHDSHRRKSLFLHLMCPTKS